MNYIKQLEKDNEEVLKQRFDALVAINNFKILLASDKFTGTDSNGDNKNWISTDDVLRHLQTIKHELER